MSNLLVSPVGSVVWWQHEGGDFHVDCEFWLSWEVA